jgi:hypothetical protein
MAAMKNGGGMGLVAHAQRAFASDGGVTGGGLNFGIFL